MDEQALEITGLKTGIKRNKNLSMQLKAIAFACLFFSFFYCYGSASLVEYQDKSDVVVTNLVWIVSFFALVGLYLKDSQCIKSNKAAELEIYRLKLEEINSKKNVASITGNKMPDYMSGKYVAEPVETTNLSIVYYGMLVGIDIAIRVYLFINHVI